MKTLSGLVSGGMRSSPPRRAMTEDKPAAEKTEPREPAKSRSKPTTKELSNNERIQENDFEHPLAVWSTHDPGHLGKVPEYDKHLQQTSREELEKEVREWASTVYKSRFALGYITNDLIGSSTKCASAAVQRSSTA